MTIRATSLTPGALAEVVARDIPPGSYVNLGIGQPTKVAYHFAPNSGVVLHTENGMLGMGPAATGADIDPDLINAGKVPVTELPGAAYFHHADSFAMMRGGHLDYCVLGAFQVSADGDLANWHTGEPDAIPAVGGAMDLALGWDVHDEFPNGRQHGRDILGLLREGPPWPALGALSIEKRRHSHGRRSRVPR